MIYKYSKEIFNAIPIPCVLLDVDAPHFTILDANDSFYKTTTTAPSDLIGKGIFQAFPFNPYDSISKTAENVKISLQNVLKTATPQKLGPHKYDIPIRGSDGYIVKHWLVNNIPILNDEGVVVAIINSVTDITEQQILLEETRLSTQRYEYVAKATSDAIWDWDLINNTTFWGEGLQTIFGYQLSEVHKSVNFHINHVHPDDLDRITESFYRLIKSNTNKAEEEYRFLKADNTYAYIINKGFLIRNERGRVIRMVGAMTDVTLRNEEILRLKLLESVIINTNDAVIITKAEHLDFEGPEIMYVNEAFTRMTGYAAQEVIGKTPRILQGPKSDRKELDRLKDCIKNWQSCDVTLLNYKKNGEEFWVNMNISPVANEKGWFTHFVAIQKDITERKMHQKEVLKAIIKAQEDERYEIGAELHDNVCQILVASKISVKMLSKTISEDEKVWYNQSIKQINLAFKEIRNLSHRLAPTFFHDTTIEEAFTTLIKSFNIKNTLVVALCFEDSFKQIIITQEFQLNLYRIFQEQLSNILKYANAKSIKVHGFISNNKLHLNIIDNGVGFDVDSAKNGIGIANMRRRTHLFSGKFTVTSSIGNGCKIAIEIPLQDI